MEGQKKRLVISQKNCSDEILEALRAQYPTGYGDALIKVNKPNGEFFHAVTLELPDVIYLVKVDVKIDTMTEEDFDKQYGANEEEEDMEDKDSDDLENIAGGEMPNFDE